MKEKIVNVLSQRINLEKKILLSLIEIPPSSNLGDYAFPCFIFAKQIKKPPEEIAKELARKIISKDFEKIEAKGPYVNFFINRKKLAQDILKKIQKEKNKFGSLNFGKGKTVVIESSSPNIAKPFGIGHLRSTIIGNSLANICSFLGFKPIKINYLGDWGTQFGLLIAGYKKFGNAKKLNEEPIKHLLEVYVKASQHTYTKNDARNWFKKMEEEDKEAIKLWKIFRELSLKEFNKTYSLLKIKFDVISGESFYNSKLKEIIKELDRKNILEKSEGALVVNLEKYGLGVCLIRKSDGTTLYITRDIAAAIERYKKHKFDKMLYEVGSEQKLYFQQLFKILELLEYTWAKNCVHVAHGLYLDKDGKKFATRRGRTIFMEDIFQDTNKFAKKEILKREKLSQKQLEARASKIALAAIFYGDLRNYRTNDVIFDIARFVSFDGNTGPYLLYTYARAKSILRKAKKKKLQKYNIASIKDKEKALLLALQNFPEIVMQSYQQLAPNLIANYSFELAQTFNEFYHSIQVIGSEEEQFRLALVEACAQVLKNALWLLGIETIERM